MSSTHHSLLTPPDGKGVGLGRGLGQRLGELCVLEGTAGQGVTSDEGEEGFQHCRCAVRKEEQVVVYEHQKSSFTPLARLPALTGKQRWLVINVSCS